jgi:serine protease AprX
VKAHTIPTSLLLLALAFVCLQGFCAAETIRFDEEGVTLLPAEDGSSENILAIGASGKVFHRTGNPVDGARTVPVPGTAIRLYLWEEVLPGGRKLSFYAVSRDGVEISGRVRATTYSIRLAGGSFDPLAESRPVSPVLRADSSNTLFLVQFVTTPLPRFGTVITAMGGRIHRFLTDHTFLVEMAPGVSKQVEALPFVRWVGPYHPEYRVEAELRAALAGRSGSLETQRYSIMICERSDARQRAVARLIGKMGGLPHFITPGGIRLEATLNHDQLLAVARSNAVQYIDRWGGPGETDMNIVRSVGGADFLEGLMGWTGQGVRGEIFDTELRTTHQEWPYSPIIHSSGTSGSYHGTACYSINFAQGIDSAARGMLPDGEGIFFLYSESSQFGGPKSRYTINEELTDPAGPYRAVFQTSSVGSSRTLYYTTISAETDDYLFYYPILSTQSQSNAGDQMSRPQAWAKNIVSVGGVYHYGTTNRSDDRWNSGASIGPAEDGRIKPDLAYFYDGIRAAYGSSDSSYTEFGGTSAATPETAGHFGLLFQM